MYTERFKMLLSEKHKQEWGTAERQSVYSEERHKHLSGMSVCTHQKDPVLLKCQHLSMAHGFKRPPHTQQGGVFSRQLKQKIVRRRQVDSESPLAGQ